MLALNEKRALYTPTLWNMTSHQGSQKLKQVWFSGVHSSVGGGQQTYGLSDITLAWMAQKIKNHTNLEFDIQYLKDGIKSRSKTKRFGQNFSNTELPWGNGTWTQSHDLIYWLGGTKPRTPGALPEQVTHEYLHRSVIERNNRGDYSGPDISRLRPDDDSDDDLEEELKW